jgi:hypothetical protein
LRGVESLLTTGRAARRIFIAISVIIAGSCSTIPNNTTPPPGARLVEAPDYNKQGGTWRFRVVHQVHGGYRSDMDQGEQEIVVRNGQDRRYLIENGKRINPRQKGTWLYGVLPTTKILESKDQYFNFPLWVEKQWNGMEKITRWHDTHCTVTGIEMVTTPAGTFETYRIVREMFFFAGAWNYYDTYVYNYSPDTRSIIKYEYTRKFKDLVGDPEYGLQETAGYELLSYKPDPQPKDANSVKAE